MSDERNISRRDLLRGRLGAMFAGRTPRQAPGGPGTDRRPVALPIHRPPKAVDEAEFVARCTRCDACVQACPHDAIFPAPPRFRHAEGTPMIDPARAPCRMCADFPCVAACEPGVLAPDRSPKMATVRILPHECIAMRGMTCTVCVEHCPVPGALALEAGKPRIDESACTGCGVCHHVCPAPTNAVLVLPLMERSGA